MRRPRTSNSQPGVLQLNGLIGKDDVMNAQTLPKVRMPNRDGFKPWVRGE
jgi:cytochrome c